QRDNRAFMASLARGRTVLDVHCHSGGFAVLAARAGAREVHGIDSSVAALALAEESATANGVNGICRFLKADAMEELERLAGAHADHPIHPMLPETAYLKALVYAVD